MEEAAEMDVIEQLDAARACVTLLRTEVSEMLVMLEALDGLLEAEAA